MTKEEAMAQAFTEIHDQLLKMDAERLALRNALKLLLRRLGLQVELRADLLMLASVLQTPDAERPRKALECFAAELQMLGGRPAAAGPAGGPRQEGAAC